MDFHLVDATTRYSCACLVYSKNPDEIVSQIFRMWIGYFGCPMKFLSDNGGEFSNGVMKELSEKFNIIPKTTAAEAPFSNGIVERHHLVLVEAISKTIEEMYAELYQTEVSSQLY